MKHQKLETIRFGRWFFDHNEFKLLHRELTSYYVDVNELTTEEEAIEWLSHLQGGLTKRDVEDFVRIVKVLLCLDRSAFRRMNRKPKTNLDRVASAFIDEKEYAEGLSPSQPLCAGSGVASLSAV